LIIESVRGHTARLALAGLTILALAPSPVTAQDSIPAGARYAGMTRMLSHYITHELVAKSIPAISIALVDKGEVVWARGFGLARPDSTPATASTVFRAGTLSEVITILAALRQVEQGRISLDSPVTTYLPDFRPRGSITPITIRELLSHTSGLPQEPPVGGLNDASYPTLAETVESLTSVRLTFPPGQRWKYSSAGIAALGCVMEKSSGHSFPSLMKESVLSPLDMDRSSFDEDSSSSRTALGTMWTVDGRRFPAPRFLPGNVPAAGLSSTPLDLARFLIAIIASGEVRGVVSQAGRNSMVTPQWNSRDSTAADQGFGFNIHEVDGQTLVQTAGGISGFAAQMSAMPDRGLGVVVMSNLDQSGPTLNRIAELAIRALLAVETNHSLPDPVLTDPVDRVTPRLIAGHYVGSSDSLEIRGHLGGFEIALNDGIPRVLRSLGDTAVVDDPLGFGPVLTQVDSTTIALGGSVYHRVYPTRPRPASRALSALVGEYGWDFKTLYILERHGKLAALVDWFFLLPLTAGTEHDFLLPMRGRYAGEHIRFQSDRRGRVTGLTLGSVLYPRRAVGPSDGSQLKITPGRPVPDLIREALTASPPAQPAGLRAPDLVELRVLDSTIHYEIRYATTNNFAGTVFYPEPHAFMQRPAAQSLLRAHRWLRSQGYGLLIHDAYRPWYVTKAFWDAVPDSIHWLVANPASGSRHNRGSAVDLTLYSLSTGQPVEMPGTYDESTPRSFSDYPGGTSLQRWHRELLRRAMEMQEFTVNPEEWWHFDHADWRQYPVLNLRFDQLSH
jgi:CubicO group peptidase (beta-lactamase class C family)/D-alanyl-D-alanine dipeptidase